MFWGASLRVEPVTFLGRLRVADGPRGPRGAWNLEPFVVRLRASGGACGAAGLARTFSLGLTLFVGVLALGSGGA